MCRCIIITGGESRIFSAGLDLMESFQSGESKHEKTNDFARLSHWIVGCDPRHRLVFGRVSCVTSTVVFARRALRMENEIRSPQEGVRFVFYLVRKRCTTAQHHQQMDNF